MQQTPRRNRPLAVQACLAAVLVMLAQIIGQPTLAVPANSADQVVPDKEILIGSCSALSGVAGGLGSQQLVGAEAYFNYINDAGGIFGRKIAVRRYDDQYDPKRKEQAFAHFKADKCFMAAFFTGSVTSVWYVPQMEQQKIPAIGFMTGSEILRKPIRSHIFAVRANYDDEMRVQLDRIWRDLGSQKVAIIYPEMTGGSPIKKATEVALQGLGEQPVAYGLYPLNSLDVDSALKTVQLAKPDIVVFAGTYRLFGQAIKRAHAVGWHPLFMCTSLVGPEELVEACGKDADGVLLSQVLPPYYRDDLPTVVLYKQILKKYFPNEKPNMTSFEGFVNAMVIVDGLKRAGKNLTRSSFVSALESIHNEDVGLGGSLKLTYSPTRHQGFDTVYTIQIRDGIPEAYFSAKQIKRETSGR